MVTAQPDRHGYTATVMMTYYCLNPLPSPRVPLPLITTLRPAPTTHPERAFIDFISADVADD